MAGGVFAGMCWWALQTFGSTFIANQQRSAGDAYGQFASIIALFAFLFLASQLSIVGAEINVVLARRLWPRSLTPGNLTAADLRAFELLADSTRQDESYRVTIRRVADAADTAAPADGPGGTASSAPGTPPPPAAMERGG